MPIRHLPFNSRNHETRVPDGKIVTVFDYSENEEFGDDLGPHISELGLVPRCGTCGSEMVIQIQGNSVTVKDPCPFPSGITSVITLFTSGKLIVTDDLRPIYDWDESGMASYNSALGQYQAVHAMASAGCAYGPVGNTCPGLYRTGEGTYVIANLAYDEAADEQILPEGWERLAGIITDLWAYSVADYDDWTSKGGKVGTLGWTHDIVEVPPGAYRFTHHTGERSFDRDAPGLVIFAHIEKVA